MRRCTPCFAFALVMIAAFGSSDVSPKNTEEIEMWLTEVNEKDLAIRYPPPDEIQQRIYEVSWYLNTIREALRLYKKYKDVLLVENKTALRLLELYALEGALTFESEDSNKKLKEAKENMFSKIKIVMNQQKEQCFQSPHNYEVTPNTQNCSILKCIWEGYHDDMGSAVKEQFTEMVELSNKAAKENDFKSVDEIWKLEYTGNINADVEMENLLKQIMPLYKELHAYVRKILFDKYFNNAPNDCGPKPSDKDPIPVHLTGNILGRDWSPLESLILPYPKAPLPDFSKLATAQFSLSYVSARSIETFFTSLGFEKFDDFFWKNSSFKSTNTINCFPMLDHLGKDKFSITMCSNLSLAEFGHLCHKMSHVIALKQNVHLPHKFRYPIHRTFDEGLGGVIDLFMNTPSYLKETFNLTSENIEEQNVKGTYTNEDINALMRTALYRLPLITYGFVLEMWRFKVFNGSIKPSDYNEEWWKLRKTYQGIVPPMERSADKFDPAAVGHVPVNLPYIKYFFCFFLEFQMYQSLCDIAGHKGSLHRCDVYGSKTVGEKLKEIFAKGSSKPPLELLFDLTGYKDYSATPMLEYYKPLYEWLKEQNAGHEVGWDDEAQ